MSSMQSPRRPMNWRSRPFRSGSAAQRRHSRQTRGFAGFLPLGWRAVGFIGRGPKRVWPYILPWFFIVLAIGFSCLVVRGVLNRQLLVPPVETPQSLSQRGYTSSFLAERIMSSMRDIAQDADSIPHDTMTDTDSQPDIQLPGQDMSYASTVRFIKGVIKRTDVVVHVGITKINESADSYVAHVQIEGGPFNSRESIVPFEGRDLEDFVHGIAVEAMRLAEPNILASHLYSQVRKTRCHPEECRYNEIIAIYDKVLTLPSPEQREWALAGKAWLLTDQGESKAEEAERQTREALTVYKHSAILHASLGRALAQQERLDDALEALRAGAREKSKTAENLRLLGDVLLRAHRNEEALDAFRQADEMNPGSVDNLHDWGEALDKVGRYDEAIDKLSRAISLRPDLAPSYAEMGRALDHKGDLRGASRKYAEALERDAGTLSAHETQLARLANAVEGGSAPEAPSPNTRTRPVSNPRPAVPFQASLEVPPNAEA
ncbi:tetratricopeptide repeat protein [Paraburkholderia strydomiana]|uniref:tetratricopeptide repeat protein n=1 Tax=Paraburkholderia strydomiana TaxID=1245417 RepID=UPI0038B86497